MDTTKTAAQIADSLAITQPTTDGMRTLSPDSIFVRLSEPGIGADAVLPIVSQLHELYKSAFSTLTTTIIIGLTFLGAAVSVNRHRASPYIL